MAYLLYQTVVESAQRYPDRIAISDGTLEMTYAELDQVSSVIGGTLQRCGMRPGARIGVLASKSTRTFAAILGASKAGACYVPVDPRGPSVRSAYILENAAIDFLIAESGPFGRAQLVPGQGGIPDETEILWLDDKPDDGQPSRPLTWASLDPATTVDPPARNQLDPAYFLYTSGSTGTPKGVVISHLNALTFVDWAKSAFQLGPEDRLSNHAPFHFDLSVLDLYGALASGASVHLVPDRLSPFPGALANWIEETRITVWYSVPSALVRLIDQGNASRFTYDSLRAVLFAGEVFPVRQLRQAMEVFSLASFHNLYGPTETNVCTHYEVPRPLDDDLSDIPIGRACPNMEAFALSDDGARCTEGEDGELVVRGPCVMLGYWSLPDLTADSIVQNPLHGRFTDPIYKTGDRVRALASGDFQFLGRRDHMVKVRGYRIELGEVEHALHSHPSVKEAAVVPLDHEDVGTRLHAAVALADGQELADDAIRMHCNDMLLRYAIPETFELLPALPRTSTGKVDRVQLQQQLRVIVGAQSKEKE